jgi:hypothetical protein
VIQRLLQAAALPALLSGCAPGPAPSSPAGSEAPTTCIDADGPGGVETYELVRRVLGPKSLELPDDFHEPPVPHVTEVDDPELGPVFSFTIHRDVDKDPVNLERRDRQRCEMKVYDRSPEALKGYENTAFTYTWRFRVAPDAPLTKRFFHVFQLKAAGSADDQHPVMTITAAHVRGADRLEIRYSPSQEDVILGEADWANARGVWIEARVSVSYADRGWLAVELVRADGRVLIDLERRELDTWRGGGIVRPKWGIYRSLADAGALTNAEDSVRFANIGITPAASATARCRAL